MRGREAWATRSAVPPRGVLPASPVQDRRRHVVGPDTHRAVSVAACRPKATSLFPHTNVVGTVIEGSGPDSVLEWRRKDFPRCFTSDRPIARYQARPPLARPGRRNRAAYRSASSASRPLRRSTRPSVDLRTSSGRTGAWKASMYQLLASCSGCCHAAAMARWWGVDRTVSEASRCGKRSATAHATAPPQS